MGKVIRTRRERRPGYRTTLRVGVLIAAAASLAAPASATRVHRGFVEATFRLKPLRGVVIRPVPPAYRVSNRTIVFPRLTGSSTDPIQLAGRYAVGGGLRFTRHGRRVGARKLRVSVTATNICISAIMGGKRARLLCTTRRGGSSGLWSSAFTPPRLRALVSDETAMGAPVVAWLRSRLGPRSPGAVRARVNVAGGFANATLTAVATSPHPVITLDTPFRGIDDRTAPFPIVDGALAPALGTGQITLGGPLQLIGADGKVVHLVDPRLIALAGGTSLRALVGGFDEEIAQGPPLAVPVPRVSGFAMLAPSLGTALDLHLNAYGADLVNGSLGLIGSAAFADGDPLFRLSAEAPVGSAP